MTDSKNAEEPTPLQRPVRRDVPEETLWKGSYSPKDMYTTFILLGIVSVGAIILVAVFAPEVMYVLYTVAGVLAIWAFFLLRLGWQRLSVKYELTNQRFIHEEGVLRRVTDRIEVIDITDVTFEQTLFERLFNVGTLHVISKDRSHPELILRGIENVREVAHMMDGARRQERLRRGLHIDSGID